MPQNETPPAGWPVQTSVWDPSAKIEKTGGEDWRLEHLLSAWENTKKNPRNNMNGGSVLKNETVVVAMPPDRTLTWFWPEKPLALARVKRGEAMTTKAATLQGVALFMDRLLALFKFPVWALPVPSSEDDISLSESASANFLWNVGRANPPLARVGWRPRGPVIAKFNLYCTVRKPHFEVELNGWETKWIQCQ